MICLKSTSLNKFRSVRGKETSSICPRCGRRTSCFPPACLYLFFITTHNHCKATRLIFCVVLRKNQLWRVDTGLHILIKNINFCLKYILSLSVLYSGIWLFFCLINIYEYTRLTCLLFVSLITFFYSVSNWCWILNFIKFKIVHILYIGFRTYCQKQLVLCTSGFW